MARAERKGNSLKERSPECGHTQGFGSSNICEVTGMNNGKAALTNGQSGANVVPFRGRELLLVDHNGEPFVPMRPVVEGMGLAWQAQHRKLTVGRFESTITEMVIVAQDGKQRAMTCLPLRKLPGWLMSINAGKVRESIRDNVLAYQAECDDVLWQYWNQGHAINPRQNPDFGTVLNRTIGTDGFHCLAAVLDGKLRRLPPPVKRAAKNHVWAQVHKAFSVVSAEDIPADQMDAARNFIGSYVLEGEWMPAEESVVGETVQETVARLAEQVRKPNSYPVCLFKPLVDAVLEKGGLGDLIDPKTVNYTVSEWIDRNRKHMAGAEHHGPENIVWINHDVVRDSSWSPLGDLLYRLQSHGCEVDACRAEYNTMRSEIDRSMMTLETIQKALDGTKCRTFAAQTRTKVRQIAQA